MTNFRNTISFILFLSMFQTLVSANTPRATIILYHGLTERTPSSMYQKGKERFYQDMEYIRDNFDVVSLDELQDIIENQKPLSRNTVVITFDDGMKSKYDIAVPILKEFGFPATFFIISDRPNNDDWFMTWNQIRELSQVTNDEGEFLFTIGSHSRTHVYPGLQNLTGSALRRELEESKTLIEQHIAPRLCTAFAPPYGILPQNRTEFYNIAAELGYKTIRTTVVRNVDVATDDLFDLPCLPLYDFTEPDYIGAFNQSPLHTTFFEPVQDVTAAYNPLLTYNAFVTEIFSHHSRNNLNVVIEATPENDALVQRIEVIHGVPWTSATIRITTKAGAFGRAKINVRVTEEGTFPSGGHFFLNVARPILLNEIESIKESLVIFPNPANDRIEINNVDETVLYKIFNSSGTLALAGKGNKIDVSELRQGVYFLTVYNDNEELTTLKFVKN